MAGNLCAKRMGPPARLTPQYYRIFIPTSGDCGTSIGCASDADCPTDAICTTSICPGGGVCFAVQNTQTCGEGAVGTVGGFSTGTGGGGDTGRRNRAAQPVGK